jgi:hypothetical protein
MLHEFPDVHFAEFSARFQVWRSSQNCQHFWGQTVMPFLTNHSGDSTPALLVIHFRNAKKGLIQS